MAQSNHLSRLDNRLKECYKENIDWTLLPQEFKEVSPIAILTVTSPIVINVPTRGLLAVETKDSFVLWLAKFKYQKTCL